MPHPSCQKASKNHLVRDSAEESFGSTDRTGGEQEAPKRRDHPPRRALSLASGQVNGQHPEKKEIHLISLSLQASNQIYITSPRKRRLKPEVLPPRGITIDLSEHQSSSMEGSCLGRERGHALRDHVGVDEVLAFGVLRQEFSRESGLAGAVRPGDDMNGGIHDVVSAGGLEPPTR